MSTKIKLTIATVLAANFAPAFEHLSEDISLPVKDRFALARTMRDIKSNLQTYDAERIKLVKEFGMPDVELLTKQIGVLPEGERRTQLEQRLEALKKNDVKSWSIDPEDTVKMTAFREKLTELQKVEFEVFLDHFIKLTDESKLTAKDIEALIPLVEIV